MHAWRTLSNDGGSATRSEPQLHNYNITANCISCPIHIAIRSYNYLQAIFSLLATEAMHMHKGIPSSWYTMVKSTSTGLWLKVPLNSIYTWTQPWDACSPWLFSNVQVYHLTGV